MAFLLLVLIVGMMALITQIDSVQTVEPTPDPDGIIQERPLSAGESQVIPVNEIPLVGNATYLFFDFVDTYGVSFVIENNQPGEMLEVYLEASAYQKAQVFVNYAQAISDVSYMIPVALVDDRGDMLWLLATAMPDPADGNGYIATGVYNPLEALGLEEVIDGITGMTIDMYDPEKRQLTYTMDVETSDDSLQAEELSFTVTLDQQGNFLRS